MPPNHPWDAIILGAGAAGLLCAAEAAKRLPRVLLLESGPKPGRKILISGGGRCNFTNTGTRAENYLSENPHFAKSALAAYTPADFIALVNRHNIAWHEKTLGQLFCDDSAQAILRLLLHECTAAGAEIRLSTPVHAVTAAPEGFAVHTSAGPLPARKVVVATGGLSIPKLGATGIGYDIARSFGHRVIDPRPALVPLVFAPDDRDHWTDLTGLSAEAIASTAPRATPTPPAPVTPAPVTPYPATPSPATPSPAIAQQTATRSLAPAKSGGASAPTAKSRLKLPTFREKILITHRGLSGPAILQISSYWRPGQPVTLDLAPSHAQPFAALRPSTARRDEAALLAALRPILPARFAERWIALRRERSFTNPALDRLEAELHAWQVLPAGTEGFPKAEVTAGGVDTAELHARSLESRRHPGLHFIGEVVDVTGWLGGYNFQWAWASATAAARHL